MLARAKVPGPQTDKPRTSGRARSAAAEVRWAQAPARGSGSLEVLADEAARRVVTGALAAPTLGAADGPAVQKKCGGCAQPDAPCAACDEEAHLKVQRKALADSTPSAAPLHPLLVEDGRPVGAGQMARARFMAIVRARVTATCDEELGRVGRKAQGCPYLRHWLDYYDRRSATQIERAVAAYTGAQAVDPDALIEAVVGRVRAAVRVWATTGKITGIPAAAPADAGAPLAPGGRAQTAAVQTKAQETAPVAAATSADPAAVQARLGSGRPLDGSVRGRMERGFGRSFASVRIHTDPTAAGLSTGLRARAFTVGSDVAFGAGEYQPGTLEGDLLIAHELAHTVQQGAALDPGPDVASDHDHQTLEDDADRAAAGAVGFGFGLLDRAEPRRGRGLQLQGCNNIVKQCRAGYGWKVINAMGVGPACVCTWKCKPGGENPNRPRHESSGNESTMDCPYGGCTKDYFKDVYRDLDDDYSQTHRYVGAHMTPATGQAACGCLPLTEEGRVISDVPLRASDWEATDILAPVADRVAVWGKTDTRTGVRDPNAGGQRPAARVEDPMTPPRSHVGEPPTKEPTNPPTKEPTNSPTKEPTKAPDPSSAPPGQTGKAPTPLPAAAAPPQVASVPFDPVTVERWIDELAGQRDTGGSVPLHSPAPPAAPAAEPPTFRAVLDSVDLTHLSAQDRAQLEAGWTRYEQRPGRRLKSQDDYVRFVYGKRTGQIPKLVRLPGPGMSIEARVAIDAGRDFEKIQAIVRTTEKNKVAYDVTFSDPLRHVVVKKTVIPDFMPVTRTNAAGHFESAREAGEAVLIADSKFTWDEGKRIVLDDQIRAMMILARRNNKPFVFLVRQGGGVSSGVQAFASAIGLQIAVVPETNSLAR